MLPVCSHRKTYRGTLRRIEPLFVPLSCEGLNKMKRDKLGQLRYVSNDVMVGKP